MKIPKPKIKLLNSLAYNTSMGRQEHKDFTRIRYITYKSFTVNYTLMDDYLWFNHWEAGPKL